MRTFYLKIKESLFTILPIIIIVSILICLPITNIPSNEIYNFFISAFFLIIGISLFNLGAEMAMTPMGVSIGSGLAKKKKLGILLLIVFAFGFLVTISEPDLQVLASQVKNVINELTIIILVAFGVGLFLVIAILKIVFKKSLTFILLLSYMLLFALCSLMVINGNGPLIPLSFDSGGVTTGPITVPYMMALGIGIARVLGDKKVQENSFGFVALCSVGSILVVCLLGIFVRKDFVYTAPDYSLVGNYYSNLKITFINVFKEVSIALGALIVFFLVCNFILLHISKEKLKKIFIGLIFTYFGLILFLVAVNIGFMPIGFELGKQLANFNKPLLIVIGFIIGFSVVLAEPAVHILNNQVEEITEGYITKRSMFIGLCIGVGMAIALAIVRIIYNFNILYLIIPGYFISFILSLFVPSIYTAIAFDSGGVASGPMTSTFILPFSIGICLSTSGEANILSNGFGIVAMVAMAPLITIQILGFKAIVANKVREKVAMRRILDDDDEQIIEFL